MLDHGDDEGTGEADRRRRRRAGLEHTADARIKDGATINQDTSFRSGSQQVAVTADAENDMVNITGNFGVPGLTVNTPKSWVPSVQGPSFGTSEGGESHRRRRHDTAQRENVTAKIENGVTSTATAWM